MSTTIEYHSPDAPIQWTGGIGRVLNVSGAHGVVARETHGGMEYTSFDRCPPTGSGTRQGEVRRRPSARPAPHTGRRAEPMRQRQANPDLNLRGLVIPYGTPLPNGKGDLVVFTPATEWSADPWVPVQTEHSGSLVGVARIIETGDGMFLDGHIFGARTAALGDRRELSPGIVDLLTVRRPNGILEVVDATLTEVSLCRHGRWGWCTKAALAAA